MPESLDPSRELTFVDHPEALNPGIPWARLGSSLLGSANTEPLDLSGQIRANRDRVRAAFVAWLGGINAARASLTWWAHTTSAKNLLSSPLGNQVLELIALQNLLGSANTTQIGVVGATHGQIEVWRNLANQLKAKVQVTDSTRLPETLRFPFLRILWQFFKTLAIWSVYMRPARAAYGADIIVLTYVDRNFRGGGDAFFGQLAGHLAKTTAKSSVLHLAYIQGPYRRILGALGASREFRYAALFAELHLSDIGWALAYTLAALKRAYQWPRLPMLDGIDFEPVMRRSLLWDLVKGGYFQNLLVYRAAVRVGERLAPEHLIYPYENKSLEKMLLLGLYSKASACRTIGYQHTSVTPRHTTLLFARGEAARTPLPNRIVTAGDITLGWLKAYGYYPDGILRSGPALRQIKRSPHSRRSRANPDKVRVLFALSSSLAELHKAALWLLDAAKEKPSWEFAIRTHPEFPLEYLPENIRCTVEARAMDFSSTSLDENFQWCDVVAYASSTVALEALMAGRPVVCIDLGELLDPDPMIEAAPLRWTAQTPADLIDATIDAISVSRLDFERMQRDAHAFANKYFRSIEPERISAFLD